MNDLKRQITSKLNSIVALIKRCATKTLATQDPVLTQEVMLSVITHETLCSLVEQEGPTQKVVELVNEFGRAVVQLYTNIENFKSSNVPATFPKLTQFNFKKPDKSMLN